MNTKNSIYITVTVVIATAISILTLVTGIKLVSILAPYYATRIEMWLAIGMTVYASLLVAAKVPARIVNWLKKDENFN